MISCHNGHLGQLNPSIMGTTALYSLSLNKLWPRQNGRYFADEIFKWIFLTENVWISITIWLWSLLLRVQLTKIKHWLKWWLGAEHVTSHYLNQWWPTLLMYASFGHNELIRFFRKNLLYLKAGRYMSYGYSEIFESKNSWDLGWGLLKTLYFKFSVEYIFYATELHL